MSNFIVKCSSKSKLISKPLTITNILIKIFFNKLKTSKRMFVFILFFKKKETLNDFKKLFI